jgi:hypothetical protein
MMVKFTSDESSTAGFISWKRLAQELFVKGAELAPGEHVTHFDVGELGINYFVAKSTQEQSR